MDTTRKASHSQTTATPDEGEHGGDEGADRERGEEERSRRGHLADREHGRGDQPDPAPVFGTVHQCCASAHLRATSGRLRQFSGGWRPTGSARRADRHGSRSAGPRYGGPGAARGPVAWPPMDETRLCLLTVHAHPDDEASKGAGTVARYHAEGVRTVLVTCTGGEAGDILNPAMDRPEVRADLAGGPPPRAGPVGRDHRLRRGRAARLPRLGHARHARPTRTPTTSPTPRSTRPSAAWSRSSAGSARR